MNSYDFSNGCLMCSSASFRYHRTSAYHMWVASEFQLGNLPTFFKNKLPSWFSVLIPSKVLALPRCCFAEDRKRNKQSFRSCCRRRDLFKVSNNDKEREPKINEKVVLERAAWNLFEIRLKLADAGSEYKVEHNAYIVLN